MNQRVLPSTRRCIVSAALLAAVLASTAACTLGPDPERPITAADQAEAFVYEPPITPAPETTDDPWWQRFGDPETSALVEQALAHNTDLRMAAARVLEAEAALRKAGGTRWPQASYGLSGSRQKNSFVLPGAGRQEIYSTTYSTDLIISWQVDLFGKLKRSRQATAASLFAEEWGREALTHTIVAQVVRARVQVATLERSLAISNEIRSSWQSTLATVERRYTSGLTGAVDVYMARENLSSVEATRVALQGQVQQARLALDVLVGRRPGSSAPLPDTLSELPSLEPVAVGIPAELLDRRPDLRQAEQQLAAATYGIGVALADLYPSLSLSASGGTASDSLSDLISTDALIYNAVANLIGPLFTGGQRRAEVQASRARVEQATAAYAGSVLKALQEVEAALINNQTTRRRLAFTQQRVEQARNADRLARERYQRGVESLLVVLDTERRMRSAEEALMSTTADLWNARIDLFLALGGDWQTGTETTALAANENNKEPEADNKAVREVS